MIEREGYKTLRVGPPGAVEPTPPKPKPRQTRQRASRTAVPRVAATTLAKRARGPQMRSPELLTMEVGESIRLFGRPSSIRVTACKHGRRAGRYFTTRPEDDEAAADRHGWCRVTRVESREARSRAGASAGGKRGRPGRPLSPDAAMIRDLDEGEALCVPAADMAAAHALQEKVHRLRPGAYRCATITRVVGVQITRLA